ncbi:hypothetical protein ACJMK2_017139 [Sinanodonta woodiana]|uniref:Uncharacterized protein n=1 Tax=Sinanodonta woodiana TaxID=1069815 RepID=A0ABD3UVX1_SINWO
MAPSLDLMALSIHLMALSLNLMTANGLMYVPPYILLCIGMTGLPVCMFLVPSCITFAGLLVNLLVMGWFMGCIDTIANLRMILRFGSNVTPFLQAMHFGYGLGAFLSPMIASPFLLNIDCSPFIDGYTVEPQLSNQRIVNVSHAIAPQLKKVMRAVHLSHSREAFYILGCIQLLITLTVLTVVFLERKWGIVFGNSSPRHNLHDTSHQSPDATDFQEYRGSKALARLCGCGRKEVVIITVLTSASLFIYDGLQSSYADYIYSYALKNVNELERREGAILNSCFWGTFALGRLIAIIMATHFSAKFMLICNITGCCIAMFLTLIWQTSRVAIYIGTCIMGLFLSSLSPTVMSLSEQFIDLNAAMTSCLVVFAALGEMICPVIVGNLFVSIGPVSFLAFCFSIVLVSFVLFWILYAVGKDTQKYRGGGYTSFVWLQRSVPSMQSESSQIISGAVKYYSPTTDETHSMEMNGMTPISDSDMHPRDFER